MKNAKPQPKPEVVPPLVAALTPWEVRLIVDAVRALLLSMNDPRFIAREGLLRKLEFGTRALAAEQAKRERAATAGKSGKARKL